MTAKFKLIALASTVLLALASCNQKEFEHRGLSNPLLTNIKALKKDGDRIDLESDGEIYSITALGGTPGLYLKKMSFLRQTMNESQADKSAPVPGDLANEVKCNPAYATRGKAFSAARLKASGFYHFLTSSFAMDNCTGKDVKHRGFWGYLQCGEGEGAEVFEIRVTYPLAPAPSDKRLHGFHCAEAKR